ncbi:MAG: hypothetical protein Q4D87_08170 [Actinomycetaceae bacterium]|nr:hypothetical protein [Actinomycetaceae bacterium]
MIFRRIQLPLVLTVLFPLVLALLLIAPNTARADASGLAGGSVPGKALGPVGGSQRANDSAPGDATDKTGDAPRTLFIGMSGVTVADVAPETVTQLGHLGDTAISNLHTRTSDPSTCPVDGWMSMRVTGDAVDRSGRSGTAPCRLSVDVIPEDGAVVTTDSIRPIPAQVADFDRITRGVDWPDSAREGVAIGMGAAITLADANGRVEQWLPAAENPIDLQLTILETLINSEGDIFVDIGWAAGATGSPERQMNVGWVNERLEAAIGAFSAYQKLGGEQLGADGTVQGDAQTGLGAQDDAAQDGATQPDPDAQDDGAVKGDTQSGSGVQDDVAQDGTAQDGTAQDSAASPRAASAYTPTNVVVASLGQSWDDPALQFAAVVEPGQDAGSPSEMEKTGNSFMTGLLQSEATKSAGLTTIGELKELMAGDRELTIARQPLSDALETLRADHAHSQAARATLTPFFAAWGVFLAIGLLAGLMHFVRRPGPKDGPVMIWRNIEVWNTVAFAWIPAAMILNLVPWWTWSQAAWMPIALTFAIAVALTILVRKTAHPVGMIAAITLVLLTVDIVSTTPFQRDGFFGSMTLSSRRFYGISNRSYIILLVSGLLATLPWLSNKLSEGERSTQPANAHARANAGKTANGHADATAGRLPGSLGKLTQASSRANAGAAVAAMGVGILAIDALPMWGADFGGPAGIIAAFLIASVLISGKRLQWRHLALWVVLTAAAMAFTGYLDAKSGTPSHIGKFWANLGSAQSWQLLGGKLRDLTYTFTGNAFILAGVLVALAVVVAAVIWAVRGLKRSPKHRETLREALSMGAPAAGSQASLAAGSQASPASGSQASPTAGSTRSSRKSAPEAPESQQASAASADGEKPADEPSMIGAVVLAILVGIVVAVPINDSGALMLVDGVAVAGPPLVAILARQILVSRTRYTETPASA